MASTPGLPRELRDLVVSLIVTAIPGVLGHSVTSLVEDEEYWRSYNLRGRNPTDVKLTISLVSGRLLAQSLGYLFKMLVMDINKVSERVSHTNPAAVFPSPAPILDHVRHVSR